MQDYTLSMSDETPSPSSKALSLPGKTSVKSLRQDFKLRLLSQTLVDDTLGWTLPDETLMLGKKTF